MSWGMNDDGWKADLDRYLTTPPDDGEPEVVGKCINCQEPIYEYDDVYVIDGEVYCEDCIMKAKTEATESMF